MNFFDLDLFLLIAEDLDKYFTLLINLRKIYNEGIPFPILFMTTCCGLSYSTLMLYLHIRHYLLVNNINTDFEFVVLYFEKPLRLVLKTYQKLYSDPFLVFKPSSIEFAEHIRECTRVSLEITNRLAGLPPKCYFHRSLSELQRLETFYYHELGSRDSLDIFNLVNLYGNSSTSLTISPTMQLMLSPDSVLGIQPAIRILKSQTSLPVENLANIFATNEKTINFICSTSDLVTLGVPF
jgi:hypothetical protein